MKGKSELPPGAQGIGDVLSHLSKLNVHAYALEMIIQHSSKFNHINISLSAFQSSVIKPKVITLANQKDEDNLVDQSKLEVITRSRHKAWEMCTLKPRLVFVSLLIG